jgi:hypothetical protein
MLMILRIIPLLLSLAVFGACENDAPPPGDKVIEVGAPNDEVFVNPEFECATDDLVEAGEGYPHPLKQFPRSREVARTIAQLEDFCSRMQERFAEPGLTVAEAERVYEVIPTVLNISDGSYGMPGPGGSEIPPVALESRVMLRKIADDRYELYYYQIGCGRNYYLYELDLSLPDPVTRLIESWSESFPC